MKVVLFCGGFGMRLREYSESVPKPLVEIGDRPILWHIMKYYAHFGHTDFILCLGWRARAFKRYFLEYDECVSNDFTLSFGPERRGLADRRGGDAPVEGRADAAGAESGRRHSRRVQLAARDLHDWNITFVDTGTTSSIGERLRAVRPHLEGEETFLANYADGLSDVNLDSLISFHKRQRAAVTFMTVKPSQTFHTVDMAEDGRVRELKAVTDTETWINAGFFVLNHEVFDVLGPGEDLVAEPIDRLAKAGKVSALKHDGFFGCMDTFKEKQMLDDLYAGGQAPWELWRQSPAATEADGPSLFPAAA
ncbi:sugar phosphate nucleotidyltransferase [Alienimonas californiensis]|uniref:Glucose-1-phosphate cytidylyltransferase n=1 Tax=Alienimonas californiensis TaxID=2527989 RepID=A0A517P424_9PLAN|nr:sugar phosphate nucleotidyltransferase [Alienimonas californiensis]QDT14142.1 Glucose-1-phosphate cytidylyltransferase [Alienimonas californiensis]